MNSFFFFFNDTATTEIYTLSLHDALPISIHAGRRHVHERCAASQHQRRTEVERPSGGRYGCWTDLRCCSADSWRRDRKSTRLNSSHQIISYAVFCLKKKKNNNSSTTVALH